LNVKETRKELQDLFILLPGAKQTVIPMKQLWKKETNACREKSQLTFHNQMTIEGNKHIRYSVIGLISWKHSSSSSPK